jgi:hypothetical protein
MENIFEAIMEKCQNKKVISLCKKLTKKLSFNSGVDCKNLCDLTLLLYLFNYTQLAMECIKLTYNFQESNVIWKWGYIDAMWGLGIKILRLEEKNDDAEKIIQKINELNISFIKSHQTSKFTFEILENRDKRRRERSTFERVSRQNEIAVDLKFNNIKGANDWRLIALHDLIGKPETGLYPNLNMEKEKIEETIKIYTEEILKKYNKK